MDKHYRNPRRNPADDSRVHDLEVKRVSLMRQLKASEDRAADYERYGLQPAAARMHEFIADIEFRLGAIDREIAELRREADRSVLEGVRE